MQWGISAVLIGDIVSTAVLRKTHDAYRKRHLDISRATWRNAFTRNNYRMEPTIRITTVFPVASLAHADQSRSASWDWDSYLD